MGQNWGSRTIDPLTKEKVKDILKEAFCKKIPSCSIVAGTCDLQVLHWDEVSGVADYILTFDQLKLEDSLKDIKAGIAKNPAITASGQSVLSGTIGKFRNHPKVSLLGVVALLGDCTFIPADWGL